MSRGRTILNRGDRVLGGRYEILKVIHSQGMSNVYLAMDDSLNKQWCLKEIRKSEAGRNMVEYYSLLQEANVMKVLNHPNIPRIVTIEEEGDSIFIVMDYVDGMSLKNYVIKYGKVDQDVVIGWSIKIVETLAYLHNRKVPIFYRDMKPENVMVQNDNNIKLLDFGISVLLDTPGKVIEQALGTKGYAAPEQSKRGNVCDLRSDIYSMGMTMYFLLTGINPGAVPRDKLREVKEIVPTTSTGINSIVNKCIQRDPNKRYQTCEELLYGLQNYMSFDEGHIVKLRRRLRTCIILGISAIALIGGSFIPLTLYRKSISDKYNSLVSIARQTGKVEDYENVFDIQTKQDVSLYDEYIDILKSDGTFSKDEEVKLLGYINPNLSELKSNSDYGELSYNIGKLYWFYYEGSSDNEGIISSVKWFSDAENSGIESAKTYYEIGVFNRDIVSSITESEDSGMYKEYWNNLMSIQETSNGDLLQLQVYSNIVSCINAYSYSLKNDGVSKEEVQKELSIIKDFVKNYTPTTEASEKKYNSLVSSIEGIDSKIDSIYKEDK